MSQSHAAALGGQESCELPPRFPDLFPGEEGGGGIGKVVVEAGRWWSQTLVTV